MFSLDEEASPHLCFLVRAQLDHTPDLTSSLGRRFANVGPHEVQTLEELAARIRELIGPDLAEYCGDYKWICDVMLQEELDFRRSGGYRFTTFQEAYDAVYSDDVFMRHYMNGLLMTQLWWSNHTGTFDYYQKSYIPRLKDKYRHLEIGTGHGLYMYPPALDPRRGGLTAWDISKASADSTRESLRRIGVTDVDIVVQDMFDADPDTVGRFDSITFSEVLEHLEKPGEALQKLRSVLSDDGYLFLNMPVNSPAPDHIFLLRSPEAVVDFVRDHGFDVIDTRFEPQTGMTLDLARAKNKTISAALIARKA
jgi:2-polyprenyl-3-methyl-5-hydroxy-6-metoxy-1,4-benzoquinol methylase